MVRARSFGVWTQRIAIAAVVALVAGFGIRVGSSSSQSLDFRDPLVWLVSIATGEVVQADSGSGEVTARVAAGSPGDSMSVLQHGPDALLLNRTTGEVARVDGSTLQIAERSPAPTYGDARLVGHGDIARLVTGAGVASVDPATAALGALTDVAGLTAAVLGDDGTLWGLDPNRRLTAVHGDTVTEVRMPDTTRPFGLVAVDGTGYLLDGSGPVLRALDGSGLALGDDRCVGGEVSTATQLGAAAEGSSVVILADPTTATVRMSDVATGTCTSAVIEGVPDVRFGRGVESGGVAFVPLLSTGEVAIIDVDDGTVRNRVAVAAPDRDIELIVKDGTVWFNDPEGAAAGVLDENGVRRQIDKFAQVEVSAAPDDPGRPVVMPGPGTTSGGDDGTDPDVTTGTGGTGSGVPQGVGLTGSPEGPTPDGDPSGLVADFTYSKRQVEVGEEVTFVDRSQGNPTAWTWDFGDGSFSTGPEATHSWDAVGAYQVMLRIESPLGSAAATATIEVIDEHTRTRPDADFRYSASRVEVGQPVTFTDRSTGNPQQLEWDFGDGITATGSEVEHSWDRAGTYLVTLTATNPLGSDTSAPAEITVYDRVEKPTAVISASATTAAVNQTITFTSRSSGNPTVLRWDFGGVEKVGETVTHSWPQPGRYTVRLHVENSAGSDDDTVEVVVEPRVVRPEARIRVSATTVEVGTPVRFTSLSINEPRTLTWHWGDGNAPETVPAATLTVTHTFQAAGTYAVRLVASNDVGEDDETVTITVLDKAPPPVAAFEFSPPTVRAGEPVQFVDRSTGGPVARWRWSWGDGTRDSSGNPVTHVFQRDGSYTVRLEVENSGGRDVAERTIRVLPPLPRAAFTVSPSSVRVGQEIQFTDRSDSATSWRWAFGDGDTSTERNPRHAYRERGTYTVTLTVTNSNGEQSQHSERVSVDPRPPAGTIAATPATGITTSTDVAFSFRQAPNSDAPESYEWDFGDGGRATGESVTHRFARGGTFEVHLTVRNQGNAPVTITRRVDVAVVPTISVESTDGLTGQPLRFEGSAPGADASYQWSWEFSDGTSSTVQRPSKTFTVTGDTARQFTATLRVTVGEVTSPPVTQAVTIHPNPVADITPPTGRIVAGTPVTFAHTATGGTATWTWTRGPDSGPGENGRFTFPSAGDYTVSLTVTNPGGGRASDSVTVRVDPAPPRAAIEAIRIGDGVFRFRNVSTGAPFDLVEWDFGDGSPREGGNEVEHAFDRNGPYQVTLTVRNVSGTDTATYDVPAAPTASLTHSPPLVITSATEVTFTNTSTGAGITRVEWIVNGEVVAGETGNTYRRTFPVGTHTVQVRITNGWGTVTSAATPFLVILP